ncbi:MAG TPA: 2Fe-2S iron-sulfur cluster-binding protein [Burkholderiales bacterium]|nr:2Fe-2S iron-sulfur cluster-binding protein [Burkholderiales bacterium]
MQITLEGHGEPVPVRAGDTMLESLLRAGVAFPFSCQAGNCGTCKCELVSGDILELEHSEHALAPEERAKGIILACRTQVWDDAVIRRIDAEDLVMHPSRVMRCRVVQLEELTHDIRGLRLAIEAGGPFSFSAGQYAQLEFAPGLSRHYSMANTPDEPELVFHVRHMPGGRTSSYVAAQLNAGDEVKVSGPLGVAYLRERHAGPVLLIAGGSGLAPIQSIACTLLAQGCAEPVTLYFGVRSERDLYHEALLRDLAARHSNFKYHVVLSEQKGDSGRRYGLVHETVAADWDGTDNLMAYLAGPPVMVEAVTALLAARGLAPRQIHADAFYNQL